MRKGYYLLRFFYFYYLMDNLLIDIGNSCIKTGIGEEGNLDIKAVHSLNYTAIDFGKVIIAYLENLLREKKFKKAGISVLNKNYKGFLNELLQSVYGIKPVFINRNIKLPLRINYTAGLGNDRICAAAAAKSIFKKKSILIIDFGTATTYTIVSNDIITGGLICPGIKTSLNSLLEKTTLPAVSLNFPKNLFNANTRDNIKAGILFQSLFTAEKVIAEAKKKYRDLYIVATGGFSSLIFGKTKLINSIDKDLVLKGINFILSA